MLLNWQGRHFMEINHLRITSYEIADYMIRTKSLLSAKELAAILEKEYPHRTLRDRLERDTLDDDGERFEFEAGDYLIDNVEARKAARAMLRRSGADVLETTLLEKSLSHLLMLENARDTVDASING